MSALGKAPTAGICEALLEQASASRLLADRIHEAARELHRERKEAEERAARERREAQGSILRAMAPSVAPDTSQGSAAAADGDGSQEGCAANASSPTAKRCRRRSRARCRCSTPNRSTPSSPTTPSSSSSRAISGTLARAGEGVGQADHRAALRDARREHTAAVDSRWPRDVHRRSRRRRA